MLRAPSILLAGKTCSFFSSHLYFHLFFFGALTMLPFCYSSVIPLAPQYHTTHKTSQDGCRQEQGLSYCHPPRLKHEATLSPVVSSVACCASPKSKARLSRPGLMLGVLRIVFMKTMGDLSCVHPQRVNGGFHVADPFF